MKKITLSIMMALLVCACSRKPAQTSGNPLFDGWYADPEGIVFDKDGKILPVKITFEGVPATRL